MNDDSSSGEDRNHGQPGAVSQITLEKAVADRIDGNKVGPVQLRMLLLCLLLATFDGYDLASMGLAVPLVARDWHVPTGAFGGALAATMVGVAVGSILLAWLGDRLGRKPVLITSTLGVGLATLATIFVSDVPSLTICRFVLGVCFGAGMPNMYSIIADIVPSRNRMFCMTLLTAAAAVGGISAGLIAPVLSDWYGWEGIFLPGGFIPLAVALSMFPLLLESPRVLAARGRLDELAKVLRAFGLQDTDLPATRAGVVSGGPRPTALLRDGLGPVTISYLIGCITSGLAFSVLAHWLPTLMNDAGWPSGAGQRSVIFIYGGSLVGGLILSWFMDRWQRGGVFLPSAAYAVAAALFVGLGVWLSSPSMYPFLIGVGLTLGGAQYMHASIAAHVFPLKLLTIALSWTQALARIGPISGPLLVGWLMLEGWSGSRIVVVFSVVPVLSAIAFAMMAFAAIRRSRAVLPQQPASPAAV
jgi:AAHS family 4-hydroxybenzoate transporter-like MFS transporter